MGVGSWRIGQELVCIDAKSMWRPGNVPGITEGTVYRLRGFDKDPPFVLIDMLVGPGIYLQEVTNPVSSATGKELSFYHWRFKPVEKPKLEISIEVFQKILDGVNKTVVREEEVV